MMTARKRQPRNEWTYEELQQKARDDLPRMPRWCSASKLAHAINEIIIKEIYVVGKSVPGSGTLVYELTIFDLLVQEQGLYFLDLKKIKDHTPDRYPASEQKGLWA